MDYLSSFKARKRNTDSERTTDEKSNVSACQTSTLHHGQFTILNMSTDLHAQKIQPPSSTQTPSTASPASTRITPSRASTFSLHPPPASPRSSLALRSPSTSSSLSPTARLPNTDPLPASHAALEGHLNHHASQLQQLADRVETINEWIEFDSIVLGRLVRDEEKRVEEGWGAEQDATTAKPTRAMNEIKESDEFKRGVHFELVPRANGSVMPQILEKGKRSASLGDVPKVSGLAGTQPSPSSPSLKKENAKEKKERSIGEHHGIREMRERIAEMKRWRKEVEKAVFWQREEFWRVGSAMGRKKGRESVLVGKENEKNVVDGGDGGEEGTGGGSRRLSMLGGGREASHGERKTWSKGGSGGRLPSQKEWEAMFDYS
ncbi:MAG: hypothetical protein Q9209_005485 [Squamulea sp. 1 TL-2023]